MQVILVEDNEFDRELQAKELELAGHKVKGVESGEEALEELEMAHPDLLIADLSLPGMDGLELVRRIRQTAAVHDLPCIAITGASMADSSRALHAGFDDFFYKPIEARRFAAIVDELLKGDRGNRILFRRDIAGRFERFTVSMNDKMRLLQADVDGAVQLARVAHQEVENIRSAAMARDARMFNQLDEFAATLRQHGYGFLGVSGIVILCALILAMIVMGGR